MSLICISSVSAANFDNDTSSENLLTNNEETTITDNDKNDIDINENIQTETPENKYTEPNTINNAENDMSFRDLQNEINTAEQAGTNYTLKGNVSFAIDDP